jgi:hypothetical protein
MLFHYFLVGINIGAVLGITTGWQMLLLLEDNMTLRGGIMLQLNYQNTHLIIRVEKTVGAFRCFVDSST